MRKKIALFLIGFVLAVGAFLLYQHLTGATFLTPRKVGPVAVGGISQDHPPTFESRRPDGQLEYLLSTKKAVPTRDAKGNVVPGKYDLTEPTATYYTQDGNLLFIRADRGTISVNDRGGMDKNGLSKSSPEARGGHLSGNVVLMMGPRDTFTDNSLTLKPGQFQVRFEKDLDLNYAEQLLTSPGVIHLRSDKFEFDGENLTIAFNQQMKRIELLRIEPTSGKENHMVIRDVGAQGFSLDETAATTRPATGVTVKATAPRHAATVPAITASASSEPATHPTLATTRGTGDEDTSRNAYKISFGQNVAATMGGRKMTSDRLYVLFMSPVQAEKVGAATRIAPAAEENASSIQKSPNAAPAAPTTTPPTTAPATTEKPAATTAPIAPPKTDDLVVTWTGPMEMRPAGSQDLRLTNAKDKALEAVGTRERPVKIQDEGRTAIAGRLWFHQAAQRVELEPGDLGQVQISETDDTLHATRTLSCQGVSFYQGENRANLTGPGRITVPQAMLRKMEPGAPDQALVASWEKSLEVDLANIADGKTKKTRRTIRHAIFTGAASIKDVNFQINSDLLDVLVASSIANGKLNQGLEHLLANGSVRIKSGRGNAGVEDAAKPDGINANHLELFTTPPPLAGAGKLPIPSRLLAEGDVQAWTYSAEHDAAHGEKLARQAIYTPKFDVALMPKTGGATKDDPTSRLGSTTAKSLVASDGVIVELEGFGNTPITAKGKTLTADLSGGRDNGKATLEGERQPDGSLQFAELTQGDNKIAGGQILLDQKNRSIDIPSKGTFLIVQPPQKPGGQPLPVEVTWTKRMTYDGRALLARFTGDVDAHTRDLLDQHSQLTCHDLLEVQMVEEGGSASQPATRPGVAGALMPSHKMRLSRILAEGNVRVEGGTGTVDHKLTEMLLYEVDRLSYSDATKTLDIPGPGRLLIQDFRTNKTDNAGSKGATSDNSGKGSTAFVWGGSLHYTGPTGTIVFDHGVKMVHQPLTPLKLPKDTMASGANTGDTVSLITLTTDKLTAKLAQSKEVGGGDTVANPVALGSGGNQKLQKVVAQGDSKLVMGKDELSADSLTFDALKNIATAIGKGDADAQLVRPGQAIMSAGEITVDLTKGENSVTAKNVRGTLQQ